MNRVENELVESLYRKADLLHVPLGGVFEISPVCNMNCRMCYVKKSMAEVEKEGGLLSLEQWVSFAEEAKKNGTLFLLLTGGEPFLREDFQELYRKLHEMGFVLSINTNGTMIDEKVILWLKEIPPSRINLTLYGAGNETYAGLCGNPKGFTQVTRAIRLLKEAGITVKLNVSMTPYNRQDLRKMIAFAEDEKLLMEIAPYMFPSIRKDVSQIGKNDRFTPKETVDTMMEITRLQYGEEYLEHQKGIFQQKRQEREKNLQKQKEVAGGKIGCRAGSSSYWITWDGKMLPCGMMVSPIADPLKEGFQRAWEKTAATVEQIRLPTACENCAKQELCHTCAAMIYAETGAFDRKPKYRCQMADAYFAACRERMVGDEE